MNGVEEIVFFSFVLDVGVDKQRVGFGVDVLHGDLEPVEAPGFRHLDFSAELLSQVFQHDAVGGSEEGEHCLDEVLFIFSEFLPVL